MLVAHGEWLRRLAAYLLRNQADADDLTQQTFEAALRSPPEVGRPIRPWLAQVLRNTIRSGARASARRSTREQTAEGETDAPTPEDLLARMRLQEQIARLMIALEEPYRTTLLLKFYDGRDANDIARLFDIPAGTVRWRISEGIKRLRQRLDAEDAPRSWRAILAPLAGRDSSPSATKVALLAGSIIGVLAVIAFVVHPFGGGDGRPAALAPGIAAKRTESRPNVAMSEVDAMNMHRAKQISAFLTVALPALAVAGPLPVFTGKPVDLDFKDANIKNVLRLLADVERVNLWTSDDVSGPVSIHVKAMPSDQALDQICRDRGLFWQRNDNVILVSGRPLSPAKIYAGKRMDPDFTGSGKGVGIRAAMATLADVARVKIEVADNVDATVNMKGRDMPWDQVFDVILWSKGLRAERRGDVLRIVPGR